MHFKSFVKIKNQTTRRQKTKEHLTFCGEVMILILRYG